MDIRVSSGMDKYTGDTTILLSWVESTATANGWRSPRNRKPCTRDLEDQTTAIAGTFARRTALKQSFTERRAASSITGSGQRRCRQVWPTWSSRSSPGGTQPWDQLQGRNGRRLAAGTRGDLLHLRVGLARPRAAQEADTASGNTTARPTVQPPAAQEETTVLRATID
ncbi:hypothetical protein PG995_006695 [Apiospora arundinis]